MARSAKQLHTAAVALANRGEFFAAKRMLESAQALDADVNLRARILGTLAFMHARTGSIAEAARMCDDALRSPGIDRQTAALLAGQMGSIMEQAGRLLDAHRWLSRAIGQIEEPVPRANLLVNRCLVGIQLQRLDEAGDDAARAARLYIDAGMEIDAAESTHNVGYIHLLRGDLVSALQEMQRARPILTDIAFAAMIDVDRAEVLREAGQTTEAEAIMSHSARAFGRRRMLRDRGETEFNLARSLLTHDPVRAAKVAGSAARRFETLGNETWMLRAQALLLRARLASGALVRGGRVVPEPRRIPTAEEIERLAGEIHALHFRNEAEALHMARQLWLARHGRSLERSTRVRRSASLEVRLLAFETRAARAAAVGRHADSRRHAGAGLDALGSWQASFGSLDLQTSVGMHGSNLVFAGLESAVRSGRPGVIFEWSERARHLSQQVVPLRPPPDPTLAAELAELRQLRVDNPTDDWLSDPRAAALRDSARERQWSRTGSARIQERIDLDGLRAALDPETALIAYVYSGSSLAALVVTLDRATVLPLDGWPTVQRALPGLRADLDMSASVRTGPMADVVRRSLDDRLAALSRALLDAPAAAAGTRRLVITVPGVLNSIPWAMLPAMRGRTFTLAVSATRWASLRDTASLAPVTAGFAVGPRVARGDEEVDAAASAWPSSRILRGDEATVDAATELASEVDLLHVAAHGRHAIDNPLFSGLELADGALFGYDIDRMPNVPSTVVLSACEVGRSSVRWGEEAIGMTRIWLHAGTRAVVATPVVVADDEACELLGAMHAELAAGLPPAGALAAASARTGIIAPFQTHGAGF